GARSGRKGAAATKGEEIRFGVVGRVLPQALSSLIPRRIVINGIAAANGSFVATAGLPGHANARLERSLVPLYACVFVSALAGDEKRAGGRVEIRLAVLDLGDRGGEIPSQAQVETDVVGQTPVVLDIGAENLPAATRGGPLEGL